MFKEGDWIRIKNEASCLSVEITAGLDPSASYKVTACSLFNVAFKDTDSRNRVRKIFNYELYTPYTAESQEKQKEESYESQTNESTNTAWGRF